MNILLLFLLLALGLVWMKGRNHPQGKLALTILAGFSLLVGVLMAFHHPESRSRKNELRLQESCGYVLGESVIRAYPGGGKFTVLNMPSFSERVTPSDAMLRGLKLAFKGHPHELIELDLDALPMDLKSFFSCLENKVPVPAFWEQVGGVTGHTALISLVGLPPPPDSSEVPLFIAGASGVDTLQKMPRWQGIRAAVQMKPDLVLRSSDKQKGSLEEIFETRYQLLEFN